MSKWLDRSIDLECGDNSCRYRDPNKPRGMCTNGGCRCGRNNPRETEMFLNRNYHAALKKIEDLEVKLLDKDKSYAEFKPKLDDLNVKLEVRELALAELQSEIQELKDKLQSINEEKAGADI